MGKGYKLMEMNTEGKLFPLFIGKNNEFKIGEWVHADNLPTKGFSCRPGIHIGKDVPDAPWLKSYDGTNIGCYRSQRSSKWTRVWCEVEYNDNHNYDEEVQLLPKKCFTDRIPEDGCYFFREVGKGTWVITSDIRIIRVLTEAERKEIMLAKGYDEKAAFAKYKVAIEKRMKKVI